MKPDSRTPFENFNRAVESLMRVPHSEIKKALDQEKQEKRDKAAKKRAKQRPARSRSSASGHASTDVD